MFKKRELNIKLIIFLISLILFVVGCGVSYAKYTFTRNIAYKVNSVPFYFDATSTFTVVFPRTASASDHEDILTTTS